MGSWPYRIVLSWHPWINSIVKLGGTFGLLWIIPLVLLTCVDHGDGIRPPIAKKVVSHILGWNILLCVGS